jgi:hypothetical protein
MAGLINGGPPEPTPGQNVTRAPVPASPAERPRSPSQDVGRPGSDSLQQAESILGPEAFGGKYVGPKNPDPSTWTQDEKEGFDAYKAAAMEALHGKTAKNAEKIIETAVNPEEGVAVLGSMIFLRADDDSAEMLGGEPPAPMTRFWAANEVVPQVFELADALGFPMDQERQEIVTGVMLGKYFNELEKRGQLDTTTGAKEFEQVTGVSTTAPQQPGPPGARMSPIAAGMRGGM